MDLKSIAGNCGVKNLDLANQSKIASAGPSIARTIVVTNPTNKQLLSWVNTSLSFAQGELLEANADSYGVVGLPSTTRVLKKWFDGSVSILQVKHPVYLAPGGTQIISANTKSPDMTEYQFHPEFQAYLNAGNLLNFQVRCTVGGQPLVVNPFIGTSKILSFTPGTLAMRFRAHFHTTTMPATQHALSCTVYAEIEAISPILKLTVVIGNDTLELPIVGGVQVDNVQLVHQGQGALQNPDSYQGMSTFLSDGQQMAFRYFVSTSNDTIWLDTISALSKCEITGLQAYEEHQASKGLMTHFTLPNKRFPDSELANVHAAIDAQNAAPLYAAPRTNIWGINLNPGSTGDQGDFGAGHVMTKALQSYSLNLFNRHFVGVYRESYRPSHYWENGPNGLDYCSLAPYVTLFFWSGRPHWHPTWNPEYPVWQARGALNGGDSGGWNGQDNQHTSNNNLRAVYELTGDWYLADLCHYYISVNYWNFFTKWANNTEAERCTRAMKDQYAMCELFYGTPEGQIAMQALMVKAGVFDTEVTSYLNQYNVPAVAPFNSCDPRVNNAIWCAPYPGNTIAVGWMTGFHNEWEFTRSQFPGMGPDLRYLMAVDKYFALDGGCKTYFPLPNPSDATYGGIGISWWAGWIMLAEKYKNEPAVASQCQFILNMVKPQIDAYINPTSGYFSDGDRWRVWE